ncbi:MAG: hypothetical protein WCT03_13995 [Candidatus Obscuribacterales bacterium]|jgi:hypothetical protein
MTFTEVVSPAMTEVYSNGKYAAELKFPNVRIHLQDLVLREKQLPSAAMAKSAVHFGLIPEDSLDKVLCDQKNEMCLCMATAASIIEEYFKAVPEHTGVPSVKFEDVLFEIFRDAKTHFNEVTMTGDHQGEIALRSHDCYKFAPTLFDLMLQQLLRYPGL